MSQPSTNRIIVMYFLRIVELVVSGWKELFLQGCLSSCYSHQQRASLSSSFSRLRADCKKVLKLLAHDEDWCWEWIKYCFGSSTFSSFRIVFWRRMFPLEEAVLNRLSQDSSTMVSKTTILDREAFWCCCGGCCCCCSSSSSSYLKR